MSDNFKLKRFNGKCWFGNTKQIDNENTGNTYDVFNPKWQLWYCDVEYNIQTIQTMLGAAQQINKMIGIHHNKNIDSNIYCAIDGVAYKVENIKKGDPINGTDVLTLKQMLSITVQDDE